MEAATDDSRVCRRLAQRAEELRKFFVAAEGGQCFYRPVGNAFTAANDHAFRGASRVLIPAPQHISHFVGDLMALASREGPECGLQSRWSSLIVNSDKGAYSAGVVRALFGSRAFRCGQHSKHNN